MANDEILIWCILIDHEKKPVGRGRDKKFSVTLSSNKSVDALKKAVKNKRANDTDKIDSVDFAVWRCKDRKTRFNADELEKQVHAVFTRGEVEDLDAMDTIAAIGEILLVQLPGALPFTFYNKLEY